MKKFRESLRQAALEASRGAWEVQHGSDIHKADSGFMVASATWTGFDNFPRTEGEANARFIAMAYPDGILRLLDRIDELEAQIENNPRPSMRHPLDMD